MGDYRRCPHGDFSGYCMRCNMTCPRCLGADKEGDPICIDCYGLGLVPRTNATYPDNDLKLPQKRSD